MKNLILIFIMIFSVQLTQAQQDYKFNHILITNDDGIGDSQKLYALAKSVKNVANRVSIIVSSFDRSGTSNYATFGKHQSTIEVTCVYVDEENNITIYVTPGNPADCVFIGLGGFFPNDPPDLVLSGINSGSNIGPEWFGSGTIGAARTAAFLGVKAFAISGFDDDIKESFTIIPEWITKLISSEIVDEIDKYSFLTVGIPDIPFKKIKGVKLCDRRISYDKPEFIGFLKIHGDDPYKPDNNTIWTLNITGNPVDVTITYDDTKLNKGYIIITPMSINENNSSLLERLKQKEKSIPEFL